MNRKKLVEDYEKNPCKFEKLLVEYMQANNIWEIKQGGVIYFIYKGKLKKHKI